LRIARWLSNNLAEIEKLNNNFEFKFNVDTTEDIDQLNDYLTALSKLQFILLQMLNERILSIYDKEWNIYVYYKDQKFIKEAIEDFLDIFENYFIIFNIKFYKPKINLDLNEKSIKICVDKNYKKNIDLSNDNSLIIITKNEFSPDNSLSIKCSAPVPIIIKSEKQYNAFRYFLNNIFRFKEFRPGQKEIIKRALELKNTVGLLPTSAGKSLCYELIMFIQPAPIIIIEPIKSLIIDQFYNLSNRFLIDKVGKISGDQTLSEREEVQKKFRDGQYLALYITPERFQVSTFRNYLSEFIKARPIAYAVIDEAHCVSEWGHDFRTSYLALSKTIRRYCNHNGYIPCFYALTGTASEVVLRDILSDLEIIDQEKEAVIRNYSFDRKELDFRVVKCISSEKFYYLKSILNEVKDELKQVYKINQVSDLFNPIYKV